MSFSPSFQDCLHYLWKRKVQVMVWLSQISVLHMKFDWENCYCKDLYETVWTITTAPLHLLSVRIIQKLVLISKPQLLHCAHQVNCNYLKTLCHQMIIWSSYCWLWLYCGYKNGFLFFEPWKKDHSSSTMKYHFYSYFCNRYVPIVKSVISAKDNKTKSCQ